MAANPLNLHEKIFFINVGRGTDTFFHWNSNVNSSKTYKLEVMPARAHFSSVQDPEVPYFVHWSRSDMKIAAWKNKAVFVVGASVEIQFQVIEAIIEYITELFLAMYDFAIESYVTGGEAIFHGFGEFLEKALDVIPEHVELLRAPCKACGVNVPVYVKKRLVNEAPSHPVALVFEHASHALLIYIDKEFKVRSTTVVDISG
ncbi:MAG: hypothetical protein ACTSU5_15120 [Promethearchaeota archaeon]